MGFMKRFFCALLLCALLLPSLTGCLPRRNTGTAESYTPESTVSSTPSAESSSGESSGVSGEETESSSEETAGESSAVAADSSAVSSALEDDTVAVTIPADFFQSVQLETLEKSAKQLGMENYCTNDDGSVTFYMTEDVHRQVAETFSSMLRTYANTLPGGEHWPAVTKCELNDTFTALTLYVDEKIHTENDRSAAAALYVPVTLYRIFLGEAREDITLAVTMKNAAGSKVLETFVYPE